MTETKREYAVRLGLAKEGRGRMGKAAHEAIKDAINKGVQFSDGSKAEETGVANTAPQRRPNGVYIFETPSGRQIRRTHTVVCNHCRYSLGWCLCASPEIYAYPEVATLVEIIADVITTKDVPEKQPQRGGGGTTVRRGTRRGGGRSRARQAA